LYVPSSGVVNFQGSASIGYITGTITNAISASWAPSSGGGGGTTLYTGSTYPITSSWSQNAKTASYLTGTIESASYALTASYALNGGGGGGGTTLYTGSTYPITSSWSENSSTSSYVAAGNVSGTVTSASYSLTASYALNASSGTSLQTGSTYPITSSWSTNTVSASYAPIDTSFSSSIVSQLNSKQVALTTGSVYPITASYALYAVNDISGSGTTIYTGSTYPITSSWSENTVSASYAPTNTAFSSSIVSQLSGKQSTLSTGSLYPITSSWSQNASVATSATSATSASYSLTASYALNGGGSGGTTLYTGSTYPITSSWSENTVSASYAPTNTAFSSSIVSQLNSKQVALATGSVYPITASYALYAVNDISGSGTTLYTGSTYPITSSWSENTVSASYAPTNTAFSSSVSSQLTSKQTTLQTGSVYPLTASWAENAGSASLAILAVTARTASYVEASNVSGTVNSASYALTASYALNGGSGGTSLQTGSTYPITSSWAVNALTSSIASTATSATSASYSLTASYALNGGGGGGTTLYTGSTYPITSSFAVTASYALNAGSAGSQISSTDGNTTFTTNNGSLTSTISSQDILTVITQSSFTSQNGSASFELDGRISASNTNVGIPSDDYPWGSSLQGSYFENWNSGTNISDILRFFAGAFSASYPSPSPNTRYYDSMTTSNTGQGSTVSITGYIPQNSSNTYIQFLEPLGWANAGSTVFNGYTFYNGSGFYQTFTGNAGGSSANYSALGTGAWGAGPLNNGSVTPCYLTGSFTRTFAVSSSNVQVWSDVTHRVITQSAVNYSISTTNPIGIGILQSANPVLIPNTYQDTDWGSFTGSRMTNPTSSLSAKEATGRYTFRGTVGFKSASADFTYKTGTLADFYYTPITDSDIGNNSLSITGGSIEAVSAFSRSLSGAPYLISGCTWTTKFSGSGFADPMYRNGTLIQHSVTTPGTPSVSISGTTSAGTSGGTYSTSTVFKSNDWSTFRSSGTIPYEDDVAALGPNTLTANSTTDTNIAQTGVSSTTFTVTRYVYNKSGGSTSSSETEQYHVAGTFGQPASSGSLAYYGRTTNVSSLTFSTSTNSETFLDEQYRVYMGDGLLTNSGSYASTSSKLPSNELQVKPGYLVDPGGAYRYWYPSGYGDQFKYYVRHFKTTQAVVTFKLYIAGNTTLVNWTDTSTANSMAIGIIFESGNEDVYSRCRLYDISNFDNNLISSNVSPTSGLNPFSNNIDIYGNNGTGAGQSSGTITFPTRAADGAELDSTNSGKDELYVIVRYNGSPTPLTSLGIQKTS
jgi:hypothetical protein